jgi:lysozyme
MAVRSVRACCTLPFISVARRWLHPVFSQSKEKRRAVRMRKRLFKLGTALLLTGAICFGGLTLAPRAAAQTLNGIDVSRYQGSIDWQQVATSGVSFAYIRAGEGATSPDLSFQTNWSGASAAGITPGAYLYFHPAQDPIAQANLLVQQLRAVGFHGGNLVPVIDVETTDSQPPATVVASLRATVNSVQSSIGALPAIYASPAWWDNSVGSSAFTSDPLWLACWCTGTLPVPANNWGGNGWQVWQYSSQGTLPGIHGRVDLDQSATSPLPYYHVPTAQVSSLPSTENSTAYTVSWSINPGSPPAGSYVLWAEDGGGPWVNYVTTQATSYVAYGFPGHMYSFYVEAIGTDGYHSGWPPQVEASTTISSAATHSITAFTSMYGARGDGTLVPGSSPPTGIAHAFGWNIIRGLSLNPGGLGGVELDGWGGLQAFGDTVSVNQSAYWPNWDIATGISVGPGNEGYVLDGWGGVHPFSVNGAPLPAAPTSLGGYWPGWKIARAVATFADGTGGVVLDGWGGVHPFTVAGDSQAAATPGVTGYWPNWDIARSIVLLPGSTYTHYSGYVLDGWGGIHPFGGAPPLSTGAYWAGWDIATSIVLLPGSSIAGYVLDGWGGLHQFGGAPAVLSPRYNPAAWAFGLSIR